MSDTGTKKANVTTRCGGTGGLWFMGFIGTLTYFLHVHSGTFWLVLVALWKAVFWPAYLTFYAFQAMHV
jgi:hypothetical protein